MPSTPQVALLRGINVGGNNMLPMARLRELSEGLGHTGVRTHLQSGNLLLTAATPPERTASTLEEAVAAEFGFRVRILVRTREELAAVVAESPFAAREPDGARLFVLFLSDPVDPERLAGIDPLAYGTERFHAGRREIHLWCPEGYRDAQLPKVLSDRRLGVAVTARNWNTVTKLLAMADG
jgi:uncharacterized protein (DUF1697 family)